MVLKTKLSFVPENAICNPILKSLLNSMLEKDPEKRITFIKIYHHPFLTNNHRRLTTGRCSQSMRCKSGLSMESIEVNYEQEPIESDRNSDPEEVLVPKIKVAPHFLPNTFRMIINVSGSMSHFI